MLLLANAHAGSADVEAVETARAVLERAGPVERATTATLEELDAALDRRAGRRLVVAGGDGSLHLVVRRLHQRGELADAELALVPLGTGNDLARALGIPLDPAGAAELARAGTARPLDLLVGDGGEAAVNAVHLGIGAEAAVAASGLKPRFGPLAYPLGALAAGLRTVGWHMRVEVDGTVVADGSRRVLMTAIGNGPGVGGGTPLLPSAVPDDGLLDVMVSFATAPLTRLAFGVALRDGSHPSSRHVRYTRGRSVTVSDGLLPVNADGEVGAERQRGTWSVVPRAWRLVTPA